MVWQLRSTRHNGQRDPLPISIRDDTPTTHLEKSQHKGAKRTRRKGRNQVEAFALLDGIGARMLERGDSENAIRVATGLSWAVVRKWLEARKKGKVAT